jgi:hypothetical protein
MKWISVKDKLPEKGKNVLVYFSGYKDCPKPSIHILKRSENHEVDNEQAEEWNRKALGITGATLYEWNGFRVDLQSAITHWMELPEPPKEK